MNVGLTWPYMRGGARGVAWVAIVCLPIVAMGQEWGGAIQSQNTQWSGEAMALPAPPPADSTPAFGQPVSYEPAGGGRELDLAARVSELERQLKAAQDKEAAAKKKAAGAPSLALSGTVQADWFLFHQSGNNMDQFGDIRDGVEFRRVRLKATGVAFEVVDYALELDFAPFANGWNLSSSTARGYTTFTSYTQQTAFKDVYIGLRELPVIGNLRIGHFKEPFGLEQMTANRYTTFMERSIADENALVPTRNMGVMAFDTWCNERGAWQISLFRPDMVETPPVRQTDNGGTAMTSRLTWLPWYDEESGGRGLLHVGGAYSYRDIDELGASIWARPEAHLAPRAVSFVMVNDQFASNMQFFGAELACVYGPLSIQTEYYAAVVDTRSGPNGFMKGGYGYVSYFLTGEHRPYDRKLGRFDRVRPLENFRVHGKDGWCMGGRGAWEVGYRFSFLDLNDADAGILGGYAADHTLGLNWYLNPYTRLMWNWVHSMDIPQNYTAFGNLRGTGTAYGTTGGIAGSLDTFEMRAQIDF